MFFFDNPLFGDGKIDDRGVQIQFDILFPHHGIIILEQKKLCMKNILKNFFKGRGFLEKNYAFVATIATLRNSREFF